MVGVTFFGNFDLASLSIWLFWGFFALLIFYLQTENMREGYPLEDEDGNVAPNQGPFPVPSDKTYKMMHGQPDVVLPSGQNADRTDLALARTATAGGFPLAPTGDPLADGVGPASWSPRRDEPELNAHGRPKIVPMNTLEDFVVSAGYDPRGMPVLSRDDVVVGHVSDLWVDEGEQEVRFLAIELDGDHGSGVRIVPNTLVRVERRWVKIHSLSARHFAGVPTTASPDQVTKLEEDKIMAYYCGGTLYSLPEPGYKRQGRFGRLAAVMGEVADDTRRGAENAAAEARDRVQGGDDRAS